MITLLEINEAINNKIEEILIGTEFSSVPLIAEDISEPIVRPSIKISIGNSTNGKFNASCKERNITCRVYFFAKDKYKYKMDNSKIQDILETAFMDSIQIKEGFYISIPEVACEVIDTVLICSFNLYTVELLPEETTNPIGEPLEPMENLNIEL